MKKLHCLSFCLPLILGNLWSAQAQATVMPQGRAIHAGKKMSLKSELGIDMPGRVDRADRSSLVVSGAGFYVEIKIESDTTCYVYFHVVPDNFTRYYFDASRVPCYNFETNDEGPGNNNMLGLFLNGTVYDNVIHAHLHAYITIWPKREDRIKAVINTAAAGGNNLWEFDIDEGS